MPPKANAAINAREEESEVLDVALNAAFVFGGIFDHPDMLRMDRMVDLDSLILGSQENLLKLGRSL